ncbi:DUF6650 family protein [Clostridium sp. MSTE9]|uniref:DUF6650 family protein n=1 Tax=Clostridium sp. (strain MSTE9) TaxID=1105031 RepID=UPI0005527BE8|nr:DUF6650 family protein [Clostridium sp. MSTE9]
MGIKITGIDTPFGGVSWEFTETDKSGIQELFFFLEAKRLLVNPIEMEIKSWCEQSAIEIKNKLTQLLSQYSFNAETIETMRHMVNACNTFLDDLNKVSEQGIIYKNSNGDWANANFSIAMKKFRNIFREKISWLSDKYQIEFVKEIPKEY